MLHLGTLCVAYVTWDACARTDERGCGVCPLALLWVFPVVKFAVVRPQFFPPSANVSFKLVIPPRSLRHHTFVRVLEDQRSAILQRSLQAENLEVSMNSN